MMPPLMTVGSLPPASSRAAIIEVVVVLPCVPPIATADFRRMSSASISARRTTGRPRALASTSSGLSRLMAEETTTTAASPIVLVRQPLGNAAHADAADPHEMDRTDAAGQFHSFLLGRAIPSNGPS